MKNYKSEIIAQNYRSNDAVPFRTFTIEATNDPDDWQEVSRALEAHGDPGERINANRRIRPSRARVCLLGGAQLLDLVLFVEFYTAYPR